MEVLKFAAVCVIASVICLVLKETSSRFGLFVTLFVSASVLYVCIMEFLPFIVFFRELSSSTAFSPYVGVLLKVCGAGIVTRLAADICRDAGEASLAGSCELVGKTVILICALPVIKTLFLSIKEFMI